MPDFQMFQQINLKRWHANELARSRLRRAVLDDLRNIFSDLHGLKRFDPKVVSPGRLGLLAPLRRIQGR
jgi:hypothetical protein